MTELGRIPALFLCRLFLPGFLHNRTSGVDGVVHRFSILLLSPHRFDNRTFHRLRGLLLERFDGPFHCNFHGRLDFRLSYRFDL